MKLPAIDCPYCGARLESRDFTPGGKTGATPASNLASCLRRCATCRYGLSNANTDRWEDLTQVFEDPFWRLPDFLREGCSETLAQALNVRNRPTKSERFHFSSSEDHLTWVVFRFLQQAALLGAVFTAAGIAALANAGAEPRMLLWGAPVPQETNSELRAALVRVVQGLGESPQSYSEPDVILDCGAAGLIIIEVKYRSPNDLKPVGYAGWKRYDAASAFLDYPAIEESGLYELARNWRIGCELAGSRPFTLVNLGQASLTMGEAGNRLQRFTSGLSVGTERKLVSLSWSELLQSIEAPPLWLRSYLAERRLYVFPRV